MKKGFTKVPNELLESWAKSKKMSEKTRVIFAILRKTNGWNKSSDWIALSQFEELTGMKKSNICRTLKKLIKAEIIIHLDNGHYQLRQSELSKWIPTKEPVTKETFTKEKKYKKDFKKENLEIPKEYKDQLNKIAKTMKMPQPSHFEMLKARAEGGDRRAINQLNGTYDQ